MHGDILVITNTEIFAIRQAAGEQFRRVKVGDVAMVRDDFFGDFGGFPHVLAEVHNRELYDNSRLLVYIEITIDGEDGPEHIMAAWPISCVETYSDWQARQNKRPNIKKELRSW